MSKESTSPSQQEPGPGPDSRPDLKFYRQQAFQLLRSVTQQLGWKYRGYVLASMLLSATFLLPQGFLQFFTTSVQTLDQITAENFLWQLIGFGATVAVTLWVVTFIGGVMREWFRLTVMMHLRRTAVKSLHNTRIDKLDSANRGDWMTRVSGDLRSCEFFLTDSLPDQIQSVTLLLGSGCLFFFFSGWVAAVPCVFALVLAWFNLTMQRRIGPKLGEARMMEGDVFQSMIENFEGLRTIRSFGGEKTTFEKINQHLNRLFQTSMQIIKTMAGLMGLNELAGQAVIVICLSLAAMSLKAEKITVQDVLVYPFYIGMFFDHAKTLVRSAFEWNRFFIEGGRLAEILYDKSRHQTDADELFGDYQPQAGCQELKAMGIEIAYGSTPPVVKDLDFEVKSGEIIAIMGPSGCGKSTFLEVLSGLRYAQAGSFEIITDDGRTQAFSQTPPHLSAFVEQRPYIFVGSFRENLTLGLEDQKISDEQLWETLAVVNLDKVIRERGGLDEILTDRGMNLSEGQRYRMALCRAFVSKRPLIVMDEPFAALDEDSIASVVQALHTERDLGAGIVLVTHLIPANLQTTRVIHMKARIAEGRT